MTTRRLRQYRLGVTRARELVRLGVDWVDIITELMKMSTPAFEAGRRVLNKRASQ